MASVGHLVRCIPSLPIHPVLIFTNARSCLAGRQPGEDSQCFRSGTSCHSQSYSLLPAAQQDLLRRTTLIAELRKFPDLTCQKPSQPRPCITKTFPSQHTLDLQAQSNLVQTHDGAPPFSHTFAQQHQIVAIGGSHLSSSASAAEGHEDPYSQPPFCFLMVSSNDLGNLLEPQT